MIDLNLAQTVAIRAAMAAGDWLFDNQDSVTITKHKDDVDIQTSADLEAEKIIFQQIKASFPNHNLFSEEAGTINLQSPYTWVIDPLDGTKEYAKKQRNFLSLVGLQNETEVIVGCVYNPNLKTIYNAYNGGLAHKNDKPLQVSSNDSLDRSVVTIVLPHYPVMPEKSQRVIKVLDKLMRQVYRVRSSHFDAWNLCLVAEGAIEGFILLDEDGTRWWDVAPALIIAKEAGAKITTVKGEPIRPNNLEQGIVVSNGLIHDQLLAIISK